MTALQNSAAEKPSKKMSPSYPKSEYKKKNLNELRPKAQHEV